MYTIAITLLFLVCVYFSYFQHFPLSLKLFFAILLYRVVGLSLKFSSMSFRSSQRGKPQSIYLTIRLRQMEA